jgi:monoamine oxidase
MAAADLSQAGERVIVLEARNRIGGRTYTMKGRFMHAVEAGAEFVHGDLPLTTKLIKEAGLEVREMKGIFWNAASQEDDPFNLFGELLFKELAAFNTDLPLADFLHQKFPGDEFVRLRNSVRAFAEGYDAADPERFSTLAFRDEWMNRNEQSQYRLVSGYSSLMEFLRNQTEGRGGRVLLNQLVKEIHWKKGEAAAVTSTGERFTGARIVVTVPLGVLQAAPGSMAGITFFPSAEEKRTAACAMGYGDVIKIFLEFRRSFWTRKDFEDRLGTQMPPVSFILSDQVIPTWWTQFPSTSNLLTGWIAGPPAHRLKEKSNEELISLAAQSLSRIFKLSTEDLRGNLFRSHVANWSADPFSLGAYSYSTVGSATAKKQLSEPLEGTVWFAGEATYEGAEMGTVEAALASGRHIARKILQHV